MSDLFTHQYLSYLDMCVFIIFNDFFTESCFRIVDRGIAAFAGPGVPGDRHPRQANVPCPSSYFAGRLRKRACSAT
jgi:hypothetical protein